MPEETWANSSKDMIAAAVRWMVAECERQNRRWNTLSDNDLIVAQGYEMIEADAMARGIPVDAVDVTHGELLAAMQQFARDKKAAPAKAAAEEAAAKKAAEDKASAERKAAFDAEAKAVADAAKAEADATKKAADDKVAADKKAADDKAAADKASASDKKGS